MACVVGSLPALAIFLWFVTGGHADLLPARIFGNFYDLQARALFHGHWNVPEGSLAFEGIVRARRTYMYYGPLPALLRMPVLLVTSRLDGRLTVLSMSLAYAVALFGASRLLWRARRMVRADAPLTRWEWRTVGSWTFALGVGSALLFPGTVPIVYHEAELWGAALALVGLDAVWGAALRPSPRRLAIATLLGTLALLSRPSVGLGPPLALGCVAVGMLLLPSWIGGSVRARVRVAAPFALGAAVPMLCYSAVNLAKFATPFSAPFDKQIFSTYAPNRLAVLHANGGSLFNPLYIPTTFVQYIRPDALRPWHLFPFWDFTTWRAPVLLGTRFDTLDRSSSVSATMPALLLLAIVAVIAMFRHAGDARGRHAASAITLGALAATVPTLAIGFIANRFLIDFVPALLVPACVGVQLLLRRVEDRPPSFAGAAPMAAVAVLLAFSIWTNLALALNYSRLYAGSVPARRGFIALQERVGRQLGTGGYRVSRSDALGPPADDTLAIVGPCGALYWANGHLDWEPLEIGPGGVRVRLRVPSGFATSAPVPLLELRGAESAYVVSVRRVSSTSWEISTRDAAGHSTAGQRFTAPKRAPSTLDVVLDRQFRKVSVTRDGQVVFGAAGQELPAGHLTVRSESLQLPVRTPLCDLVIR